MKNPGLTFFSLLFSLANAIRYQSMYDDFLDFKSNYETLNENSLNWGPYRSNLYMGIRPRIPESIVTGLLWFPVDTYEGTLLAKHACDQNHDLNKFGWIRYDPRFGGQQLVSDNDSKLNMTMDFVKTEDGKNWALKVKGKSFNQKTTHSIVFYAGLEGEGAMKYLGKSDYHTDLIDGDLKILGFSERLGGDFDLDIIEPEGNKHPIGNTITKEDPTYDPSLTHHLSLHVPGDKIWQAFDVFMTLLKLNFKEFQEQGLKDFMQFSPIEMFQVRNINNFEGNLHFVQKTFVGDFEFSIIFNMDDSEEKFTPENLQEKINKTFVLIDNKFTNKYQLQAPFNTNKYVNFAKEILSQLMGGIGYFYGDQMVDRSAVLDDVEFSHAKLNGKPEGPYELFTCVPSRPFFPRGFYWDEGFHLLPLLEYDSDLALEIVKSWFSLIDHDGWIAREQILGNEARTKVPDEFTVQNPNIANPPTLMMVFSELLDTAKKTHIQKQADMVVGESMFKLEDLKLSLGDLHMEKPELLISYANDIYPKLQIHYEWFRKTQRGEISEFDRECTQPLEVYRWKGRTRELCLPSGIDDYPRCEPDIAELNVDLMSWMGVMTRSMQKIAHLLGKEDDSKLYQQRYNDIIKNMDQLHWSEKDGSYCDVTVDDDDEDTFECHTGYVSLMPFVHRLIPASSTEKLFTIIKDIRDPEKLWSPYGIRSLSKQDNFFHKGEDYWRGHVWININYLVLESLYHYGLEPSLDPEVTALAKDTYKELRKNLVENIYNEYIKTGFAWEQYNETSGSGQRTKNFLGWTSLVVLMMKMPENID